MAIFSNIISTLHPLPKTHVAAFTDFFVGGQSPIYISIYVYNFSFIFISDVSKFMFQTVLLGNLKFDYIFNYKWSIDTIFDWSVTTSGIVYVRLCQNCSLQNTTKNLILTYENTSPEENSYF